MRIHYDAVRQIRVEKLPAKKNMPKCGSTLSSGSGFPSASRMRSKCAPMLPSSSVTGPARHNQPLSYEGGKITGITWACVLHSAASYVDVCLQRMLDVADG